MSTANPVPATMANGAHVAVNGSAHASTEQDGRTPPPVAAPAAPAVTKKAKRTKPPEPTDTSALIQAKIFELEKNKRGEEGETEELEKEVKKASKELSTQTARMSDLQKIDHLTKRCADLLHEMKKHERENLKNKKRGDQLQKEKDQSRTELSKTIGLKEKLEKLCRELQKENNKLKNENKSLKDNQVRSQNTWDDKYSMLLQKLDDCQEEKDYPRGQAVTLTADELFRSRFKSLIDQYELRDLHFHSVMRTKELEVQYNMARLEHEKKRADGEAAKARQLNEQVQNFCKTEAELRNQLTVYVDKFKQVEDTLNNSNDLFLTFRKEMEDMSKKTKALEKENDVLKRRYDNMNHNVIVMSEERTLTMKKIDDAKKREGKLRSIIGQMQQQGRGIAPGQADVASTQGGAELLEGDESEGEDEDEDEDEDLSDQGARFGEDDASRTGHAGLPGHADPAAHPAPRPFGPAPPPPVTANGH